MAALKPVLIKYGAYIELAAYILAFVSIFLPFKNIQKNKSILNLFKRKDIFDLMDDVSDVGDELLKFNDSGNASYIKYSSGICVLIFTIISAGVVALNTFARNIVENLKNNNKEKAKIIDIIVELIPLVFTFISFILTLISTGNGTFGLYIRSEKGKVTLKVGFYLLLIAIIVALAVRIIYIIVVKEIIKTINKKPEFENREVKAEQTEQTANEVVVPVNGFNHQY